MLNILKSAISRQAKASKLPLVLWLNEIIGFHPTFSALGRASQLSLLSLNEIVQEIILFEKETYESRLSRSFNNSLYFSFNVALRKDF